MERRRASGALATLAKWCGVSLKGSQWRRPRTVGGRASHFLSSRSMSPPILPMDPDLSYTTYTSCSRVAGAMAAAAEGEGCPESAGRKGP